jgi:hypothetical protein
MDRRRSLWFAALLIALGAILLLRGAGVIPDRVRIWPLFVVAIGLWLVLGRLLSRDRSDGFVLPLVVIAVGLVFVLEDTGALANDEVLLPLIAVAIGAGLVLSGLRAPAPVLSPAAGSASGSDRAGGPRGHLEGSVALEDATGATVRIEHGAGRLEIRSHLGGPNLLEGRFEGDADVQARSEGDHREVRVRPRRFSLRSGSDPFVWVITLTRRIPVSLDVVTGAGRAEIDLSDLHVPDLSIQTGASRIALTLPARGRTSARIRGGAAQIKVSIPGRVAAQIERSTALSNWTVDLARFPEMNGVHRSPGFDEAEDRVELMIEARAASVEVA